MEGIPGSADESSVGGLLQQQGEMESALTNNEDNICRDFLRSSCTRGNRCKFRHPDHKKIGGVQLLQRSATGGLVFCHDYQNAVCSRANCRFFHGSRQEEEVYKATGDIPMRDLERAKPEGIQVCKDHLSTGECTWGRKCKYLHITESGGRGGSREWDMPDPKKRLISYEEDWPQFQRPKPSQTSQIPGQQLDMLALCEENILLRRQVEELKKQVCQFIPLNC